MSDAVAANVSSDPNVADTEEGSSTRTEPTLPPDGTLSSSVSPSTIPCDPSVAPSAASATPLKLSTCCAAATPSVLSSVPLSEPTVSDAAVEIVTIEPCAACSDAGSATLTAYVTAGTLPSTDNSSSEASATPAPPSVALSELRAVPAYVSDSCEAGTPVTPLTRAFTSPTVSDAVAANVSSDPNVADTEEGSSTRTELILLCASSSITTASLFCMPASLNVRTWLISSPSYVTFIFSAASPVSLSTIPAT